MGVVETGPDVWRLAISYETTTYAESTGLALDPEKPIAISVGEVKVIDVLPADILDRSSLPFTVSELLGTWSIDFLNRDCIDSAPHCTGGACSDLITFDANQTAYLELSERTAIWTLNDGNLSLSFTDSNTQMDIIRLSLGDDTSTVLQWVLTSPDTNGVASTDFNAGRRMMVKRAVPAPSSATSLLGVMLSSAHFITANDSSFGRRSSVDGGLIYNFGFVLNDGGSGQRLSIYSASSSIGGFNVTSGGISNRDVTWELSENRLIIDACLSPIET